MRLFTRRVPVRGHKRMVGETGWCCCYGFIDIVLLFSL